MNIKTIPRPWQKDTGQRRYNPDPFYQSSTWKQTKTHFKTKTTPSPKGKVPNTLCYDCYQENRITPMHTVDHRTPVKDGGSRTDHSNLRSICAHHHAIKSAKEGNAKRKKV